MLTNLFTSAVPTLEMSAPLVSIDEAPTKIFEAFLIK